MALALGVLPSSALEFIKEQRANISQMTAVMQPATPTTGVDQLLPGAAVLPASVGSRLTIKNALIGAALAVTGYLTYAMFFAPPKKSAPTVTATVAGLFGARRRRRRRR